jgi:uncharacterized membrane protein
MNKLAGKHPLRPFRGAVLRGLAIVMPPLLTIVLFIWAWTVIESYILVPVERLAERVISHQTREVVSSVPQGASAIVSDGGQVITFRYNFRVFVQAGKNRWIGYYDSDYIKANYLRRTTVLPLFISSFLLILYLMGKFVAAGIGRMIVHSLESLIHRLPLVSNVYSSVKQVTDLIFTERETEFSRVVAVEYPRKGIWSVGFVTGESFAELRGLANEPVLAVLMPTSPMPMTGFTITVLKSETIELNMTLDQALQFIVSCGVVTPPNHIPSHAQMTLKLPAVAAAGSAAGIRQMVSDGETGKNMRGTGGA